MIKALSYNRRLEPQAEILDPDLAATPAEAPAAAPAPAPAPAPAAAPATPAFLCNPS